MSDIYNNRPEIIKPSADLKEAAGIVMDALDDLMRLLRDQPASNHIRTVDDAVEHFNRVHQIWHDEMNVLLIDGDIT